MTLTKEQIVETQDLKTETVNVPEWGGDVILTTMSGKRRDEWENLVQSRQVNGKVKDIRGIKNTLLALTMVDEYGVQLFEGDDGIDELAQKSGAVIDRLFEKAQRLNALSDEDVEELRKNS